MSTDDPDERRHWYTTLLDEIAALGATDVSLVVRWSQEAVGSSVITRASDVTAPDEVVLEVASMASARGLRVFVLPTLHLRSRAKGVWRGTLRPADEGAWWDSYSDFVLHYARLSQQAHADLFAVGSELVSLESRGARWRLLIQRVRAVFDGKLTYSANWDHFEPVPFWDAVDVVGVTAYQGLSKAVSPTEAELEKGWAPFLQQLRGWAARKGVRYVFTEVGYPSHVRGAAAPWDYRARWAPDVQLQLRCYRALFRVWQGDPGLAGLYAWNWFGKGGVDDPGFTPRGKPAADVLRHWYRRAPPAR